MTFLQAIARVVVGLVFILSGFLKLIDPVGSALKVAEYLSAISLNFLIPLTLVMGVGLALFEFILGISVLLGLRMRISSVLTFITMIFFTIVTLILVLFNPISDCGCFGELIQLTNIQSFLKNVVLLILSLFLFLRRRHFIPIGPRELEWFFMAFFVGIGLSLSIFSYRNLPLMDFSDFKPGTDIVAQIDEIGSSTEYEAIFIYEKDGKREEFQISELPDSSWTYIDSEVTLVSSSSPPVMDFFIRDTEGNYQTDYYLALERPLFIAVITKIEKISKKKWDRLNTFAGNVVSNGGVFLVLTSSSVEQSERVRERYGLNLDFYYGDYKNLITLNRSNGGVVYMYDGSVVAKWSISGLPVKRIDQIINQDADLYNAKVTTRARIRGELWIAAIFLLIIVIRSTCRLIMKEGDGIVVEKYDEQADNGADEM